MHQQDDLGLLCKLLKVNSVRRKMLSQVSFYNVNFNPLCVSSASASGSLLRTDGGLCPLELEIQAGKSHKLMLRTKPQSSAGSVFLTVELSSQPPLF